MLTAASEEGMMLVSSWAFLNTTVCANYIGGEVVIFINDLKAGDFRSLQQIDKLLIIW